MTRCAVLLLAAGLSLRFAARPKLTARLGGRPLACWSIDTVAQLGAPRPILVAGPQTDASVTAYAKGRGLDVVLNPTPAAGLGTSIAAGARVWGDVEGAYLCLADMPFLRVEDFRLLAVALEASADASIAATLHAGRRGHPVLFLRRHFDALRGLSGDAGAGQILEANREALVTVPSPNPGVLFDVDTEAELARAEAMLAARAPPLPP